MPDQVRHDELRDFMDRLYLTIANILSRAWVNRSERLQGEP
jgi:hypothetical protein